MGETVTTASTQNAKGEQAGAKVEKTIKDYLVENLRAAADRADISYNGTKKEQATLTDALRNQADYTERDEAYGFFGNKINESFEKGLTEKGYDVALKIANHVVNKSLSDAGDYPTDPKIAAQYQAIYSVALNDSIKSRAEDLGLQTGQAAVAIAEEKQVVNAR